MISESSVIIQYEKRIVNHAARVIAVFNCEKDVTKSTTDRTDKVGVPIVCIEG